MPLLSGPRNVGHNITVERAAGRPLRVARAIALSKAYGPRRLARRHVRRIAR